MVHQEARPHLSSGGLRHGAFERELTFEGFRYTARVVAGEEPDPARAATLVLGGSSQDRLSWTRYDSTLGRLGPLVTVDLPGYGGADFLPARHGIDFLTEAVRHLLDALGMPRVNVVGACFGGAIALRLAQRHPERLERLVLVGMTKAIPPNYAQTAERWLRMADEGRSAQIASELVAQFMSPTDAGPVRRHAAVSRLLLQQFTRRTAAQTRMDLEHTRRLLGHDWFLPLPAARVPALVLTGEYDSLTTPAMGREAAACLAGAWFTTVKEADHLVPVERSTELGDLFTRFLSGRPVTALPYCNPAEFVPGTADGHEALPPQRPAERVPQHQ